MGTTSNINFFILKVISPVFILAGAAGYFMPHLLNFICTTWCYNLFHLNIGIIGIIVLLNQNLSIARIYNIFLGGLLVSQATISFFHFFPTDCMKFTVVDDIINMDVGAVLLFIGIIGFRKD